MDGVKFERYMEKFIVTQWKDGCVYKTQSLGCAWFPDDVINDHRDPSVMYVAASDDFARTHASIRRQKT